MFKIVPTFLSRQGKVLHHSSAWNSNRNEYLVAFDLDVDNDDLPDQLFAVRLDTLGGTVDKRMLNFTTTIDNKAAGVYTESLPSCWFSNLSHSKDSVSSHL